MLKKTNQIRPREVGLWVMFQIVQNRLMIAFPKWAFAKEYHVATKQHKH